MPKSKTKSYDSPETLVVTRRMMEPGGAHFEERAIINDLIQRFRHLESTLRYYDHKEGRRLGVEIRRLRQDAWDRIQALPDKLRGHLEREWQQVR